MSAKGFLCKELALDQFNNLRVLNLTAKKGIQVLTEVKSTNLIWKCEGAGLICPSGNSAQKSNILVMRRCKNCNNK